ncbi:hypothetical protein ACFQU2_11145 [Siccirubricoccus deserti]
MRRARRSRASWPGSGRWRKRGRDPTAIGLEVWISGGAGDEASWAQDARYWKRLGATHLTLTNTYGRRHHKRIPGRSIADHLAVMRRFHAAVAEIA